MMLFKIAFRNIMRNQRRSLMTGSAVAVGVMAMLVFGGYIAYIFSAFETGLVQRIGHLTVFRSGYFVFGAGNPAAYGIDDYQSVMRMIAEDPVLKPMIRVITPTQSLLGIAGNFSGGNNAAKTFLGTGVIPSNQQRMRQWNEYGVAPPEVPGPRLSDDAPQRGLIGGGMARILGLCPALKMQDCPAPPQTHDTTQAAPVDRNLTALAQSEIGSGEVKHITMPQLDLLSATANGAPNVVALDVAGVAVQGVKELDDNYVVMPLALAQQLVYGRGEHKATGIVLQLHRSEDLHAARARLRTLIAQHHLDLEVRDFAELTPFYVQVVRLFSAIFLFIALIMGVIVLFAVVNTMTMNVMERTNEIGTIRAMGVRRNGIRAQFVTEGWMLGAVAATVGVVLAFIVDAAINHSGLTWLPPGNATTVPFRLATPADRPLLLLGTWLGLVLLATFAALLPANRAARLPVVDALRHV
ncbi:MAG TPA: FtsX-like permease family protein [Acetobacteraceae bacterium]|nr:FtsX-like permease family protein [Acetobacteraceae bacterium]